MADPYDEAVQKIAAAEKPGTEKPATSINIGEALSGKESFVMSADYSEVASKINKIVLKNIQAAQPTAGMPLQEAVQYEAKKQLNVGMQSAEKGFSALKGIGKGLSSFRIQVPGREIQAASAAAPESVAAPDAVQYVATEAKPLQKAMAPHLDLGRLFGSIGKEIDKVVVKAPPRKAGDPERIAKLSVPDQIAELEKISLEVYEKKMNEEELGKSRKELLALLNATKNENLANISEFERNLITLRNDRLKEALSLTG